MKKILSMLMVVIIATFSLAGCGSKADSTSNGELNVFVWTEYVPDSAFDKFSEETGIKVNVSTYSSNEDMLSKVKSESEGTYDVVLPSDYMIQLMIAQDMLETLDKEKLTNIDNIGEAFLDPSYDPGNVYSVPYQGGVAAIAVNKSKIDTPINSYKDLFDASLAGQLVVLDDYRAVIGMTARSLGYSMNETDPAKLAEIEEKLMLLKDNISVYDSDSPKSVLISGDCNVGMIWSAEIALSNAENPDIEVVYPEEGAYLFLDNWAVLKGSKNYDNAMKFINFMLDADTAVMVSEEFPYLCPNEAAVEIMGSDYSDNLAKNPPASVISSGEYVENLDNDVLEIYNEMWTKLKE